MHPGVALAIAYVSGSIPSAYLAGKWKGVDLRKHGSGNLGATNVVRVLGGTIGAVVFTVDILKGFLPVALLVSFVAPEDRELWAIAIGMTAIIGHVRSIFLLGRGGGGGKGVATAAGVFLALSWVPTLVVLAVWAGVFAATRYVSAASLAAAVVLPVALFIWLRDPRAPVFLVGCAITVFVFLTHRGNISRLRRGEEHRFARRGRARTDGVE